MYDRSYCATKCTRKNCERNLGYHKPVTRFFSASKFDEDAEDDNHMNCASFSPVKEGIYENF